ncbi:MAG: cell wall-binding repeat-containing protein, partial [Microcella sp.]|nr:cell wall-binding repeat-containing protein [Microcella sp.]
IISIINAVTFVETESFVAAGAPQDIVFSPNGARAYVTLPNEDAVRVIDAATTATITTYAVGDAPDGIALDSKRNRLIVASGGSTAAGERVNFVNISTGAVTSLALAGDANKVYVDAARDRAYISMFGLGFVAKVDLTTDTLVGYLNVGGQPLGMSPSFDGRMLFLARGDAIQKIDLETGFTRGFYTAPGFTNDVVMSLDGRTVYSTSYGADAVSVARLEIDRIFGASRYDTAIEISKAAYSGTNSVVYIASGTSFPDALSLAPAVSVLNGPLLLNPKNTLLPNVLAEIERLNPDEIFIAGSNLVISDAVEAQLEATGADVLRLWGPSRYATSQRIVQEFFDDPAGFDDLYLVTGRNFPDALSAGAAAGANGMPMLLVDGLASSLPSSTLSFITDTLKPERVILVGGSNVMSAGIFTQVNALPGVDAVRAAGTDRYATSVAVTELGFDYRTSPYSYWTTGANFPDALAGITLAALDAAPIYMVRPTCLPSNVLHGAWRHNADEIRILGSTLAVSAAVQNFTRCAG